jgi:hypothetical protein
MDTPRRSDVAAREVQVVGVSPPRPPPGAGTGALYGTAVTGTVYGTAAVGSPSTVRPGTAPASASPRHRTVSTPVDVDDSGGDDDVIFRGGTVRGGTVGVGQLSDDVSWMRTRSDGRGGVVGEGSRRDSPPRSSAPQPSTSTSTSPRVYALSHTLHIRDVTASEAAADAGRRSHSPRHGEAATGMAQLRSPASAIARQSQSPLASSWSPSPSPAHAQDAVARGDADSADGVSLTGLSVNDDDVAAMFPRAVQRAQAQTHPFLYRRHEPTPVRRRAAATVSTSPPCCAPLLPPVLMVVSSLLTLLVHTRTPSSCLRPHRACCG